MPILQSPGYANRDCIALIIRSICLLPYIGFLCSCNLSFCCPSIPSEQLFDCFRSELLIDCASGLPSGQVGNPNDFAKSLCFCRKTGETSFSNKGADADRQFRHQLVDMTQDFAMRHLRTTAQMAKILESYFSRGKV